MRNADSSCVFCKIVAGQIPCHKVAEGEHVLAFLDVGPLSTGHTLVIPKGHYVTLDEVPAAVAAAIGEWLPRLSGAVVRATGVKEWNVLQNNGRGAHQVVPHVHFHIIPKPDAARGLGVSWPAGKLDAASGAELARSIARALTP